MYKCIKYISYNKGFELCGIARCHKIEGFEKNIEKWINKGKNADMAWIEKNNDIRQNPELLVEGAKSIIVLGNYYGNINYDLETPRIARYAQNIDYHIVMRNKMIEILEFLKTKYNVNGRCFVDSAPISERYWAYQAGIGWIGKNGMIVNKDYGSYTTLGVIIIDKECDEYDSPTKNRCGTCRKCIDNCPTQAIDENREVDCRKCLSYLTIEHRGDYPEEKKTVIENNRLLYGCDKCIEICPWNIKAIKNHKIITNSSFNRESFKDILNMSNNQFKREFGTSPFFHSGKKNIIRNITLFNKKKV